MDRRSVKIMRRKAGGISYKCRAEDFPMEQFDSIMNVNVKIAPGWFRSKMNEQVADAAQEQKILNRMTLHAYGDTRDLGKMAEFLVGDGAAYITGQDFAVDGGALAFSY